MAGLQRYSSSVEQVTHQQPDPGVGREPLRLDSIPVRSAYRIAQVVASAQQTLVTHQVVALVRATSAMSNDRAIYLRVERFRWWVRVDFPAKRYTLRSNERTNEMRGLR
jgi:hypothetical protein